MKHLFFAVFLFLITNPLFAANFTVIDFMALDGAEQALVSGAYDTFTGNFKPAGFTQISKFKVRKTAQDMGIQLSTASPQQMKPVMDKLKVTHIVFGKVRKINSEYVVTVSFIKAGTDSPLATDEAHFSGSHVEPVKALALNLAKKLRGGKGGGKTQAAAPAKVLNEPGIIYGYLKVFPKDLGPFPNDPEDIINNINAAQQFGYNTWRVPTENELALLVTEGYIKNAQGYMSDANGNGKLRLVTDKKTAKELEEEAAAEEAEEERLAREAEAKRVEEDIRRHQCESESRLFPCKDNSTGLFWSDRSSNEMDWNSAKQYCDALTEGGYTNWRLPNIDELRTLLTADRVSNRCRVSEKNRCLLVKDCWSCSTCTQTGVPNSDDIYCSSLGYDYSDGRYSKLGDNDWLWSSSSHSNYQDSVWYVIFSRGFVGSGSKDSLHAYVRCVSENANDIENYSMSDDEAKRLYMEARAMEYSNPEEARKILLKIIDSVDFESIYYRKAKRFLDGI